MSEEDIVARLQAMLAGEIERNEWALFRWGKSWADCTEAERHEAMRLRSTPLGGGFEPRTASGGVPEPTKEDRDAN